MLLDLSTAFDIVNHDLLIRRLQNSFGVSGTALDWVKSYLTGRTQAVIVSGATSAPRTLAYGVPQGSVIGPDLFTLYTSSIRLIMHTQGVRDHDYAGDTQGYLDFRLGDDGNDQSHAMEQMVHCVLEVDVWLRGNDLKNNIDKLVCIYLSSSSASAKPFPLPLEFGATTVEPSRSARNFGVLFDQNSISFAAAAYTCDHTCRVYLRVHSYMHSV